MFALVASVFCFVLALRPVPALNSPNDTGRYVEGMHQFCAGSEVALAEGKNWSYKLFYFATYASCWTKSTEIFMFEVALFLPLIFLLCVTKWHRGVFLWGCSLMFSVTGLEMMTNALRQNLGTLLLFGAIALLKRNKYLALLFVTTAAIVHNSALFYTPLLLLLMTTRVSAKTLYAFAAVVACLVALFFERISELFAEILLLNATYSAIYVDSLSISFVLFMIIPIYWVFGVRYIFNKIDITREEKLSLVFTTSILFISFVAFPTILYRFAIVGVALQVFSAARAITPGIVSGCIVFTGMIVHLSIMIAISSNYLVLING